MSPSPTNDLGRDKVGPLLFRLALPAIFAQVVNALYNIVDRIYIGHMGADGDLALTGLGICFPIITFISALAGLAGQGGAPQAAIAMGEGDDERANSILGNSVSLILILAAAATVLLQIFKQPLLMAFGASQSTIGYAMDYLSIYLWGSVCVLITLGLNTYITAQGFSTIAMLTVLIGAALNIVLDPVFIFLFDMGVKGAAVATVLAQTVSALWVLRFLNSSRSRLRIRRRDLKPDPKIFLPIMALGISPFIMQATESLISVSFNASLRNYGGDAAVGAMTICSSVLMVMWLPTQGLAQGAQPIMSYNYGAGSIDRVKQAIRLLLLSCGAYLLTFWVIAQLFPGALVALFNDDPQLTALATWALRVYLAGMCVFWIQMACQQAFIALGQAKISLFLALLRKVILLVPLIFILPRFFDDKVFAVFLAEPVADITAAITCAVIFLCRIPKILKQREEAVKKQAE